MAVKNLDEVRAIFEDKLGLNLDYTESFPQYGTRMAMYPVGETSLEVLEGVAATSDTAQWIAAHGQSLYHICLEVDDIDAALIELKAKGVKFLNDTPIAGHANSRIAFLDPTTTANILIEIAEMPAGHAHGSAGVTPA